MNESDKDVTDPELASRLTDEQWHRLCARGAIRDVDDSEILFTTGQRDYPMILVEDGEIEVVRDSPAWMDEEVIAVMDPRSFAGELGLLNGQRAFLTARAIGPGRVREVSRSDLRRLLAEDDELGDIILHALWARRESLRRGSAAMTLNIVGAAGSPGFLSLRRFANRLDLVHMAVEIDLDAPAHPLHARYAPGDLPIVFLEGQPIVRATPGMLAEQLGLSYEPGDEDVVDLVVIGGGPAGLASAIYAASEGLSTVLVDAVAPGGQAASTSRIENYLGFPFGVSGDSLTGQAVLQAIKFGVRVCAPCEAVSLRSLGDDLGARMSSYLVRRIREESRIRVHLGANVTGLDGDAGLSTVVIDTVGPVEARGLFCFIGAEPATEWLTELDRDDAGFIRTGTDVTRQSLERWQTMGREPLPFETSVPRVFAAGDVRRGSMKRVAAAVGEGSSAVASVHRALAAHPVA